MARAIHTVLHVPMEEHSIGPYPETFGSGGVNRTGLNGYTPFCLRKNEDNVNAELKLTTINLKNSAHAGTLTDTPSKKYRWKYLERGKTNIHKQQP